MRYWAALLFVIVSEQSLACTSPTGVAGQIHFSSPELRFCDGTTWKSLGINKTTLPCLVGGQIAWNPTGSSDPNFSMISALMHFEGTNGSTSFPEVTGKTAAVFGDAQITTSDPISGFGQSAVFDGNGDYLTFPSHAQFAFGTDDFTIEFIYKRTSKITDYSRLLNFGNSWNTNQSWAILDGHAAYGLNNQVVVHAFNQNGNTAPMMSSTTSIVPGTWYRVAVTRSGNDWRLFINGNLEATATWSGQPDQGVSNSLEIGACPGTTPSTSWFHGQLDELRITKGIARYTSNYTVSSWPFVDSGQGGLFYCDGTSWGQMHTATNLGASTAPAGLFEYEPGNLRYRVSDGSHWFQLGP